MWEDTEHKGKKDTVKGHHKKGICVDAKLDVFFSFFHVINIKGHVGPMYKFVYNFGLNY